MQRFVARAAALLTFAIALPSAHLCADPVAVRYPQGTAHGFLALLTLDGKRIATGDVTQTVRGDRIVSRLTFHFRDGSLDDDTTTFTQRGTFRLVSDHHIQKGPSYPKPMDILIDVPSGQVTTHDQDGKVAVEHMDMPADLSNGLPPNLLMNLAQSEPEHRLSFIAPTSKPRLIHVLIKAEGKAPFTIGQTHRNAIDYLLHVELGGVTGLIAPLIGKQPDDIHIWILPGPPPAFIREEGQLYLGGPVWRIEQVSPSFAR